MTISSEDTLSLTKEELCRSSGELFSEEEFSQYNNTVLSSELVTSVRFHDYIGYVDETCVSSMVNNSEQTEPVVIISRTDYDDFVNCKNRLSDLLDLQHPEMKDAAIQCKMPDITIEDIKDSDAAVMFYTGFPSFSSFNLVFTLLEETAQNMCYWKGSNSASDKAYQKNGKLKPGPKRKLRIVDEMLLIFMRLRLGLLEEDLARRFNICSSLCSQIWRTWVPFLLQAMVPLLMFWPSREPVQTNMPEIFKRRYPRTRVILDCTGIRTETPESTKAKSLLYSNYKSHMTWKILFGVTPSGVPCFVSDCYGGSFSDKKITELSGVLELCEPGDSVMVDKGFLISDLTNCKEDPPNHSTISY